MTIPEETPVNELIDTAFAIEDRAGVALGPVVVNGCYEPPAFSLEQATPEAIAADATRVDRFVSPREADDLARAAEFRAALRRPAGTGGAARRAAAAPPGAPAVPLQRRARPRRDPPPRRRAHGRDRAHAGGDVTGHARVAATITDRAALDALVERDTIVICCGSGGVGKTTTAAVIAQEAARRGRDAVVVTIDPAKRLANALGLDALSDTPSEVPRELWDPDGTAPASGRLSALMLDTKTTFDRLVTRYAVGDEQAERILANGFYRNVSGALSGTQEYMAMEKLYELHEDGGYEIIVVDTPPTRHALDFLDAPDRLLRMLDNRIFRLLMMPTRAYLRVASVAVQTFLRTVSRVVGSEVVDDIVSFFRAFEGHGSRVPRAGGARAQLLADSGAAFVLVTSPRRDAIDEAAVLRATARGRRAQCRGAHREPRAPVVRHGALRRACACGPTSCRGDRRTRPAPPEPKRRRDWPRSTTTSPTSTRSRRANAVTSPT